MGVSTQKSNFGFLHDPSSLVLSLTILFAYSSQNAFLFWHLKNKILQQQQGQWCANNLLLYKILSYIYVPIIVSDCAQSWIFGYLKQLKIGSKFGKIAKSAKKLQEKYLQLVWYAHFSIQKPNTQSQIIRRYTYSIIKYIICTHKTNSMIFQIEPYKAT